MRKNEYSMEPADVPKVKTTYREIVTKIPVPESIPLLERLWAVEAKSLHWQAPVIWDRAEGSNVFDKYGNKWLDLSCGIVVTNIGHGRKEVIDAIVKQAQYGLLYNFTFPSEVRMNLLEKLVEITPPYLQKGFLMSAGSEATENALKLMRRYAHVTSSPDKNVVVSFNRAFHGRTLGAQMMGGLPPLKNWIMNPDPDIIQVPHPNEFYDGDTSFDTFEKSLEEQGVKPENVAGVILEGIQGSTVFGVPKAYAQALRKWTTDHGALMVYDEVQMGFGRTGKMFSYMHYDVEADIVALGKAISGNMPISATLARKEIMDVFKPGEMTSTHTGNPIACAAALANLDVMMKENLIDRCAKLGVPFKKEIDSIVDKHGLVGYGNAVGLIAGLQIVNPGTNEPRKDLAYRINQKLYEKGIMVFCPVGPATIKLAPPFTIPEDALLEALAVVDEAVGEVESEEGL
ncbi:MAG: class-III pyridoxal-phosphate-dependent aminotransferase [Promethearchaeota archaeon]